MQDKYDRRINYLRISVTDLCNLRCTYCMPAEGVQLIGHEDILSFEEIFDFTKIAVGMGITKVRLTGGEPLVRKNVMTLVRMLAGIDGIDDYAMTTNGVLLDRYAQELKDAGLHRLNISLDTLDSEHFAEITRGGDVNDVLRGIQSAQDAGFELIKLNCVIHESSDEPDAKSVTAFAKSNGCQVRFIRRMHIGNGDFWAVEGGDGGNCHSCNRLRLSSDGKLYPCLFNDIHYSVRELGSEQALKLALENKPESGHKSDNNQFYSIGG